MSESKEIETKEDQNDEQICKKLKSEDLKKIPIDSIKDRLIYINVNDIFEIVTLKQVYSEKKDKNFDLYQCVGFNCEGNAIILEGWENPGKAFKELLE